MTSTGPVNATVLGVVSFSFLQRLGFVVVLVVVVVAAVAAASVALGSKRVSLLEGFNVAVRALFVASAMSFFVGRRFFVDLVVLKYEMPGYSSYSY